MGTRTTSLRTGCARRSRRLHAPRGSRRLARIARCCLGTLLIWSGGLMGAFGTIGWLVLLDAPSATIAALGVLLLGAVPLLGGLTLLWLGLGIVEEEVSRTRVLAVTDDALVAAAREGGSATMIAFRVGVADVRETEARLDALVVRERIALDVTDDGDLVYRAQLASEMSEISEMSEAGEINERAERRARFGARDELMA